MAGEESVVSIRPRTCQTCEDFTPDKRPLHLVPWRKEVAISKLGLSCEKCALLKRAIEKLCRHLSKEDSDKYDTIYIYPKKLGDCGPLRINIHPQFHYHARDNLDLSGWSHIKLQLFTLPDDPPSLWPSIGVGFDIAREASSDACMKLAKGWIDECISDAGDLHSQCKVFDSADLPTRVIHIDPRTRELRLHVTEPGEKGRYATLSHCWGGSSPLKTTSANIEAHRAGCFAPLPRTFQDAVTVTAKLGIEYLWIDAICIIQDSVEDWASQAARMADVYSLAYLRISADAADDCNKGFLASAGRIRARGVQETAWINDREHIVRIREKRPLATPLPYHGLLGPGWLKNNYTEGPRLSTRAWVLQERLFSQRTLHFAWTEMAFQCRSRIACECCATTVRREKGQRDVRHYLRQEVRWTYIVKEYTTLDLTFESDRSAAIVGLAKAISGPDDEYLFGLWGNYLKESLLWITQDAGSGRERRRIGDNTLPSWSWISTTAAVKCWLNPRTFSDRLEVRALERPPIVTQLNKTSRPTLKVAGMVLEIRPGDEPEDGSLSFESRLSDQGFTVHTDVDSAESLLKTSLRDSPNGLLFLLISGGVKQTAYGLLLQQTQAQPALYERVAYADTQRLFDESDSSDTEEEDDDHNDDDGDDDSFYKPRARGIERIRREQLQVDLLGRLRYYPEIILQ